MRIARITQGAFGATILLALLSGGSLFLLNDAIDDERQALAERAEQHQLSSDLSRASDFLTNEARLYTIYGDRKHFENYWREVNETKTRDWVVARLEALGAPENELALI